MEIRVLFFASARDLSGVESVLLELSAYADVATLRKTLGERYPKIVSLLSRCALAVDEEFVSDDVSLFDGATVAVLPPVSGG